MLVPTDPGSLGLSAQRLERVTHWLQYQVDSQRLAGCSVVVGRRGQIALAAAAGFADLETRQPFALDSVVRIYSMTKAVTTAAAMMLYEEGCFHLDDPVAHYLPEFKDTPVWMGGSAGLDDVVPQRQPMTVRHLMTHTSGLTYGFMHANEVDAAYRAAHIELPGGEGDLAAMVTNLAALPLLCQPGSQWNYSVSTDVLGRLIEIWSGLNLEAFLQTRLLQPLGMIDTGFCVHPALKPRFTALYSPRGGIDMSGIAKSAGTVQPAAPLGLKCQERAIDSRFRKPAGLYSGGGGLTGTIGDYARFCQMLLNRGVLDGERVLGRKTVEFMRLNHLPENKDMAAMGQPVWSETSYEGIGFGLGWAVVTDPVKAQMVTSVGEHHWGGAASTFFWLDPLEDLYTVFFTQLMPSSTYPIRRELRTRVYQALTD